MPDDRKRFGTAVEQHVRKHLESRGWIYRESNWRYGHGELDLVMIDDEELVFVEVKARRSDWAGRAEEAVSRKQASVLLRTGEAYSTSHPDVEGRIWRIDLIAVSCDELGAIHDLTHYENAIVIG